MSERTKQNRHVIPGGRWLDDLDDETSIDDLTVAGCDFDGVRLERMGSTHYWLGIYVGGQWVHIDITSKRKIKARVRKR